MSEYRVRATMEGLPLTARVKAESEHEAADTFGYYLWCHGFKDDDGVHVDGVVVDEQ